MNTSCQRFFILLLSVAAIDSTCGGELVWDFDPTELAITQARLLPGQVQVARTEVATEPTLDLQVQIQIEYGSTDVVEKVRHVIYFGTTEGVQQDGVISIPWDSSRETLTFREVASIAPDGKVIRFSPAEVRLTDDNTDNVFTDQQYAVLQLQGLVSGSMAVLEYERSVDRGQLRFPWLAVRFPQAQRLRHNYELRVRWQDADVPVWDNSFSQQLACSMPGPRELHCAAAELAAFPLDPDVAYFDELPQFMVGAQVDWDDIIALAINDLETAIAADQGVREIYEQLAAGISSKTEMLKALHSFVSRDIRYVSFSEGEHSVVPHPVEVTLANRFGDCKDKAALLLALLRMAGINAYAALVATDRSEPARLVLPGIWYFDHMVICLESGDGEHCLDATDMYAPVEVVSPGIQGRVKLDLIPGSRPSAVSADTYLWSMAVQTTFTFTEDGNQQETTRRTFNDAFGTNMRNFLASRSGPERLRWAQENFRFNVSDRVSPQFILNGVDELSRTMSIDYETQYVGLFEGGSELNYEEADPWLIDLAADFQSGNRFYNYQFAGLRIESGYEFVWPPGWGRGRPLAALSLESEFGSMRRTSTVAADGVLKVNTVLEMPRRTVSPGELAAFNRFIDIVRQQAVMKVRSRIP